MAYECWYRSYECCYRSYECCYRSEVSDVQKSDLIRAEYQAEIAIYVPSMLVFVDESGTDQHNATQHFGYALRGCSTQSFKFLSRGKRLSAIAALTISQLLCYELYEQNVECDTFYLFVQRTLLPTLNG